MVARGLMEKSVRYEVVFEGRLLPGFTAQRARENITRSSLLSPVVTSSIAFDGALSVLYSSSSKRLAFSTSHKFQGAGLDCHVRKRSESLAFGEERRFSGVIKYIFLVILVLMTIMAISRLL